MGKKKKKKARSTNSVLYGCLLSATAAKQVGGRGEKEGDWTCGFLSRSSGKHEEGERQTPALSLAHTTHMHAEEMEAREGREEGKTPSH